MKTFRLEAVIAAALLVAAAGTATAQQAASPVSNKLGYVNPERVMREARESQQVLKALEAEFKSREAEIASGPKGDIERRMIALVEDMNLKRDQAQKRFVENANAAIRRIGQQENFDAVFLEATYAAARVDLTDKVIKALNAGR